MRAARAAWAGCVISCCDDPDRRMFICNPLQPRQANLGIESRRSVDVLELSEERDPALKERAEKLARLRTEYRPGAWSKTTKIPEIPPIARTGSFHRISKTCCGIRTTALVNGAAGIVALAPDGRPTSVVGFGDST